MSLFKRKLLIGNSEDTVVAIIEHLEKSNVPFEIGIKDIVKQSSGRFRSKENNEVYEFFYTIEVRKKYAEQVEAIISQYLTKQDAKQSYKLAKKKNRKLDRKENVLNFLGGLILFISLEAIKIGKSEGADIVTYIACLVLLMYGLFMVKKYYIEFLNEKESLVLKIMTMLLMFIGIGIIIYGIVSLLALLL